MSHHIKDGATEQTAQQSSKQQRESNRQRNRANSSTTEQTAAQQSKQQRKSTYVSPESRDAQVDSRDSDRCIYRSFLGGTGGDDRPRGGSAGA
jgi:hypothetical protein